MRGLYTLEERQKLSEPPKKRKEHLSATFDLLDKSIPDDTEDPHYNSSKSPWFFLIALEAMLRTFVKAGSYYVPDDMDKSKNIVNVEKGPIEDHLARVRQFILEWKNHPKGIKDMYIMRQVTRIDLFIREKWWRMYRDADPEVSFTYCIRAVEATAESK